MDTSTQQCDAATNAACENFLNDVVEGLSKVPGKRYIPSRYLYDELGCELFEAICDTPEYYPTRTELAIMRRDAATMAEVCGPNCRIVELGSGASIKTEMLLDALDRPAMYVPVDIAPEYLGPAVEKLTLRYPSLAIDPVCADFAQPFDLPKAGDFDRTIVYFPGSTIGNFTRDAALKLLSNMRELTGPEGGVLVGMDLKKDVGLLVAAYNDAQGVTKSFTHNVLTRMQRELDADLDDTKFEHFARYNVDEGRIEIYLCSTADQQIKVGQHEFEIAEGELINTEYSYKYDLGDVQRMATDAGIAMTHAWLDELNWFGVFFFSCAS